jgi:hypothetical protein
MSQAGKLISLKPRGFGGASRGSAGGEWEQWPGEGGASNSGHGAEDDDLQRAIAASLADPDQGGLPYNIKQSVHVDQHSTMLQEDDSSYQACLTNTILVLHILHGCELTAHWAYRPMAASKCTVCSRQTTRAHCVPLCS